MLAFPSTQFAEIMPEIMNHSNTENFIFNTTLEIYCDDMFYGQLEILKDWCDPKKCKFVYETKEFFNCEIVSIDRYSGPTLRTHVVIKFNAVYDSKVNLSRNEFVELFPCNQLIEIDYYTYSKYYSEFMYFDSTFTFEPNGKIFVYHI